MSVMESQTNTEYNQRKSLSKQIMANPLQKRHRTSNTEQRGTLDGLCVCTYLTV